MKHILSLVGVLCVLSGCGLRDAASPPPTKKDTGKEAISAKLVKSDPKVEMKPATIKEIEADIAAQKGKIVVVDFWSFLCKPCKDEFPNLVRLHHELGDKGLKATSVCLTMVDAKDEKPKAEDFLKENKAVIANYWVTDDEGYEKAGERWKFKGIPVVAVYDREGKLAKTFTNDDPDNQFTYTDVERYLKELMAK